MSTKNLLIGIVVVLAVTGAAIFFIQPHSTAQPVACTEEAKLCPDGSAVGRTGPNCEFAACPMQATSTTDGAPVVGAGEHCGGNIRFAPVCATGYHCQLVVSRPDTGGTCVADTSSAVLHAALGQKVTGADVSLTPLSVVSDSRCPVDVQCVWAGTVEVRVRIESGMGTSEMTIGLGKSVTTEAEEITLTEVAPAKHAGTEIPASSYRFAFEVKKR